MSIITKITSHSFMGLVSILPALLIMPAMSEVTPATERLLVPSGTTESKSDLSWTDFSLTGDGAAVDNGGDLTLTGTVFSDNTARYGGAIENSGTLSLIDSTFTGNAGNLGGGIDNYGGSVILSGTSVFTGNSVTGADTGSGGAISNDGATATLTVNSGVAFSDNTAVNNGGAIYNNATATITGATFDGNDANYGGGLYNVKTATVTGVEGVDTFKNNNATIEGGAIYAGGNTTVSNATFVGNTASIYAGGIYNKGTLSVTGSTFDGNSAKQGGAITDETDSTGGMTITDTTFKNNSAESVGALGVFARSATTSLDNVSFISNEATDGNGGAMYIGAEGKANITNGSLFDSNTATLGGGAIAMRAFAQGNNQSAKLDITDAVFQGNTAGTNGGAIDNYFYNDAAGDGYVKVTGSTFTTNSAAQGGAIYNHADDSQTGAMSIANSTFSGNTSTENGGAIFNEGTMTFSASTFGGVDSSGETPISLGNTAQKGGAILNTGTLAINGGTFTSNTATGTGRDAENKDMGGGAIYSDLSTSVTNISGATFTGNSANYIGGAMYVYSGTAEIDDTVFEGNSASWGGAVYTKARPADGQQISDLTITNSEFNNNTAKGVGALGIMRKGIITDTDFTGNKATDATDDGAGALFLGSESYTTLTRGTFDSNTSEAASGALGTRDFNQGNNVDAKLDINGTIFTGNSANTVGGAIDNYFYNDAAGDGYVKVTGSTFTENEAAKGGAIYNHISQPGDTYQGQTGNIYFADSNFTGNIASDLGGAIYNEGIVTVAANNADVAFSDNMANGALNDIYNIGTLNLTALENHNVSLAGGITGSADSIASNIVNVSGEGYVSIFNALTNQTVNNNGDLRLNADLTGTTINNGDGAKISLARDITASGENVMDGYNGALAKDITVAEGGDLTINDATFESGDGKLINVADAVLRINDSVVNVAVENAGTLISDPTYYGAEVVNVGTASFTGDVFESGSSLTNSAIVDLNNVEFKSGSSLIGNAGNTLNLVGTGNIFNGSSTGNNVVLASGANYTGTLYDGVVDARNGGIDTITGSVSGGDLYVDANLTSGEVDTFGGTSGATIKSIKLANAGYGTEDKVELAIGEATLANDLNIDGINYYTSIVKDGDNIVFSDKLINESNLYSKLGSWTGGNYIATSADMENVADGENYMTVGQALSALDTNLKTVSTAGTIAAGQTGFVTGDAVYNAFASQTASAVDLHDAIAAIMATDASANAKRGALGQLLMTGTVAGQTLTAYTTAEAMSSFATLTGEVMSEYDFGWNINEGLQNDLDGEGKYKIDVLNDDDVESKTVAGAINANTSAISANTDAIATLNDAENVAGSVRNIAKGYADETLAAAKDYVDGKGYQTADDVTGAINSALAGYTTNDGMSTAIDNAIGDALANYTTTSDMTDAIATAKGEAISSAKDYTDGAIETALADYTTTTDMNTAIDNAIGDALADYTTTSDMTDAIATAKGEAISSAKDYTDGAIETALADYTTTAGITTVVNEAVEAAFGDGSVVANAVDERIEASLADDGAINTAISGATKMAADDDDTTSLFANFDEGASVTDAVAALDTTIGDMSGFGDTNTGNNYATHETVAENLTALDGAAKTNADAIAAIEDGTTVVAKAAADGAGNNIAETYATKSALNLVSESVDANTENIATIMGDENTNGSIKQAAANAVAQANAYTDSQLTLVRDSAVVASNAYTDRRIEDLDKNLSAGVAGAVALSSVAVSGVERGEVSVGAGYGYFNGQSAAAFGATMGLSNRWSINAGAGISNADVSFRAGTNYKFKLF